MDGNMELARCRRGRTGIGQAVRTLVLTGLCTMAGGCASPPANLDLRSATLVQDRSVPRLALHGFPGRGTGAGAGAATGAGVGLLAGILACAGTGPFVALCAGTVVPSTTAIGVVSGGLAGAIRSEGAEAVDAKRTLLANELAATPYPERLGEFLRARARDRFGADLPPPDVAAPADWTLEVALLELATDNSLPDRPFALRLRGRVRLWHLGDPHAVFELTRYATPPASLTTAQWGADDGSVFRDAMDRGLQDLADQLLNGLCTQPNGRSVCHPSASVQPGVGSATPPSPSPAALPVSKEVS